MSKSSAATDMNELKRNSIAREYKYQLLSFLHEYETMEQYEHQKAALLRRAEYSTELLHILDPRSAVEVMEDFKAENERIKDRINEQKRILKYKANKLMEAVQHMNEMDIQVSSPALTVAKKFINA
ncbi:MAG: hypothetical protein IJA63_03540 [Akkermansia sp.]|nr:hypothetical protein [Akkermansia sp.]MBQ7022646.1 hypothetical protein [Akkermansia sp.]